ncbi:hypothetical protein DITRI_Ditri09bG0119200 [Diplodiscus trichospermus]
MPAYKSDPKAGKVPNKVWKVRGDRSYKEVLIGSGAEDTQREAMDDNEKGDDCTLVDNVRQVVEFPFEVNIDFDVEDEDLQWLEFSVIGRLKDAVFISKFKDCLDEYGIKSEVAADPFLDAYCCWDKVMMQCEIPVWIVLEEVSLQLWNIKFFRTLGNQWCSFVIVDEDTLLKQRFDRARMLVIVESRLTVPSIVTVNVNGYSYKIPVSLEEELITATSVKEAVIQNCANDARSVREKNLNSLWDVGATKESLFSSSINDSCLHEFTLRMSESEFVKSCRLLEVQASEGVSEGNVAHEVENLGLSKLVEANPASLYETEFLVQSQSCKEMVRNVKHSRHAVRRKKKVRKELNKVIRLGRDAEVVTSDNSVSDEDIEARNCTIKRTAVSTLEWDMLWFWFLIWRRIVWWRFSRGWKEMIGKEVGWGCKVETKLETINSRMLRSLWGSLPFVCEFSESSGRCRFGNICAPNNDTDRALLWEELRVNLNNWEVSWYLGGYFNIVRYQKGKIGATTNFLAMNAFLEFIESVGLVDLPLVGCKFTWCSNRENPTFCRLDRFLVEVEFLQIYPTLVQKLCPRSISDHFPVSIGVESTNWGPRPFKFFNYWLEDDSHNKNWCSSEGINDPLRISKLEEEIHYLENQSVRPWEVRTEVMEKRALLWSLLRAEERAWQQKSRFTWLTEADRNTKFFHMIASNYRRRVNSIELVVINDAVFTSPQLVKEEIAKFYESHFNKEVVIPLKEFHCDFNKLS